jgi:hypothetical protein
MHVYTHLSEKYEAMRTPENGQSPVGATSVGGRLC